MYVDNMLTSLEVRSHVGGCTTWELCTIFFAEKIFTTCVMVIFLPVKNDCAPFCMGTLLLEIREEDIIPMVNGLA